MIEYRIIRASTVGKPAKYRVQSRRWFWWSDIRYVHHVHADFVETRLQWFNTIEEAQNFIVSKSEDKPIQDVVQWYMRF